MRRRRNHLRQTRTHRIKRNIKSGRNRQHRGLRLPRNRSNVRPRRPRPRPKRTRRRRRLCRVRTRGNNATKLIHRRVTTLNTRNIRLLRPTFPILNPTTHIKRGVRRPTNRALRRQRNTRDSRPRSSTHRSDMNPKRVPRRTIKINHRPKTTHRGRRNNMGRSNYLIRSMLRNRRPRTKTSIRPTPIRVPHLGQRQPYTRTRRVTRNPRPYIISTLPRQRVKRTTTSSRPTKCTLRGQMTRTRNRYRGPLPRNRPTRHLKSLNPILPRSRRRSTNRRNRGARQRRNLSTQENKKNKQARTKAPFGFWRGAS